MDLLTFLNAAFVDTIFGKGKNRPMTPEGFLKFATKLKLALSFGTHQAVQTLALTGNLTLTDDNPGAGEATLTGSVLLVDPGGADRELTVKQTLIPPGIYYVINTADAAESVALKNAAGTTVVTVAQNERAWFVNTGTALFGATGLQT